MKDNVCPNCGAKLVKIVYGMPSPETIEKYEKEEVALGGCEVIEDIEEPCYHCFACNNDFFKNLEILSKDDSLVFNYRNIASNNFMGDSDGFMINIYEDLQKNLEYIKINFDEQPLIIEHYTLELNIINKIKDIINNSKVFELDTNIDNGSCDGNGNGFFFQTEKGEKDFLVWNICESSKEEIELINTFNKISNILKDKGFNLKLDSFNTKIAPEHYYIRGEQND